MRTVRVIVTTILPAAATACPTGWTPSPAGTTCFLVPPERSTSLFHCVDLCEEHGGTPACIGSAEENAMAAELAASNTTADGLWLGLYQNETGLGPAKGWDRCVEGDAPSYTNWHEGPDDFAGYQEDCAFLDGRWTGQWRALACDGGVRFDPLPWKLAELSCLCARGNASAAFADDREALEATSDYNQWLLWRRTAGAFATAIAIALLPTLLLLGRAGWRRLPVCRGASVEPSVKVQGAATSPSQSATAAALSTPSGTASSAEVKGRLRAARASAAGRRLRVSFAMGQAGLALSAISLTPTVMYGAGQSIVAAVGSLLWFLVPFPLGYCLLALALFPTDARAIRVACATSIVLLIGLGALHIAATLAGDLPDAIGFPVAAFLFAAAAAFAPTLRCRGDRAMQPRPALRRLWIVGRLYSLGRGVLNAGFSIIDYVQGHDRVNHWALAAWSIANLMVAALATPRNRGRIHRRLGRLGGRGTEAEEAAAVAALVGGSAPDAALERASKLLRCLPASRLLAADLTDNTTAPPAGPTLHERTEPATMGEVTAFLSHSWSDEKEAPGAKHALVALWAEQRQETTGKEPTLWLVALRPTAAPFPPRMHQLGNDEKHVRLASRAPQDKACIDQNNIEQSLACLPVFLAGCQTLLVVAGPTYCSRLWCVMELFTFARSECLCYMNPDGPSP